MSKMHTAVIGGSVTLSVTAFVLAVMAYTSSESATSSTAQPGELPECTQRNWVYHHDEGPTICDELQRQQTELDELVDDLEQQPRQGTNDLPSYDFPADDFYTVPTPKPYEWPAPLPPMRDDYGEPGYPYIPEELDPHNP